MQKEIDTRNSELYTKQAISIATFIGGPLAAGYLIRENFLAIDEPKKGKNVFIISIVATIALFVLIFSIPEHIIEKIPNIVLPVVYTVAITIWVEQTFGTILKKHEELKYSFYSVWRAIGIGIVSLLIIGIGIFGYAYLSADTEATEAYQSSLEKFYENEKQSLAFYRLMQTESDFDLILELNKNAIPKWKENIEIVKSADTITDLPKEISDYNKKLLRYSELRLEAFEVFKKALKERTVKYDSELRNLHEMIDKQLEAINE
ncbi:hypothetical protein C8N46_101106 [Kordia periserrulae]|uniref:Uncharacterized protein n=1 Tax=Kordia periserrulae TaxID=701523 RepID=A0A2T6C5D9_9FLAO|nr:hypothetical protein [Kordia periserrulae]PTX63506.1 hypothetical protein C8N46_101106 [Kordia periserrulae]